MGAESLRVGFLRCPRRGVFLILFPVVSVAAVRSKDADCLDRTDFGPDQTARAVCSLKTEKYGPDHRPTPDRD